MNSRLLALWNSLPLGESPLRGMMKKSFSQGRFVSIVLRTEAADPSYKGAPNSQKAGRLKFSGPGSLGGGTQVTNEDTHSKQAQL